MAARRCAEHALALCSDSCPGTVLEIGAGTGFLTQRMVQSFPLCRYCALDIAPGMALALRCSLPSVSMLLADGEHPPFPEGCADLLVSNAAFQWYTTPELSIPANLALLRPGGSFSLSIFVTGTLAELARCSELSGFGSMHALRPDAFYTNLLAGIPGLSFESDTVEHVTRHSSVMDFLKQHRRTGATPTPSSRNGQSFGRRKLSRFIQAYEDLYREQSGLIPATYSILHLWGTRG